MKFVVAAMKFFGKRDGQGIHDFAAEIGKMTPADREEIAPALTDELRKAGILTESEAVEI